MAQFNPTVPDTNDPNWLSWSKPISDIAADKSVGQLISGTGDLVKGSIDVADQWTKKDIDAKVYAQVDPQMEANKQNLINIRNSQIDPSTALNINPELGLPDVPNAVKNGLERINTLAQASAQGGGSGIPVNDTYLSANITAIAKNIRSEYPGYREYIDQKVSEASGMPIANAFYKNMIQDINHANSAANSAKNKIESLALENVKNGYTGASAMYQKWTNKQIPDSEMLDYTNTQAAIETNNKRARDRLSLTTAVTDDDKNKAKADYSTEISGTLNTYMNTMMIGTPFGDQRKLGSFIEDVRTGKVKLDPKQAQEFAITLKGVEGVIESDFQERANRKNDNGISYSSRLGGYENIKPQVEAQLQTFRSFSEGLTSDKYGLVNAAKLQVAADKSMTAQFMYNHPTLGRPLKTWNFIKDNMGDQFLNTMTEELIKSDMNTEVSNLMKGEVLSVMSDNKVAPNPAEKPSLETSLTRSKNNGVGNNPDGTPNNETAQFYDKILDLPKVVGRDDAPLETRLQFAEFAFNPRNLKVLDHFNMDYLDKNGQMVAGKYGAYNKLTAPEVVKGMAWLRDNGGDRGKQAWANFQSWSEKSLRNVIGGDLMHLSELPSMTEGRLHIEYQVHPQTNTYRFNLVDDKGRPFKDMSSPYVENMAGDIPGNLRGRDIMIIRDAQQTLERINSGVGGIARIAQEGGKNPSAYMLNTLITAGFTPGPTTKGLPAEMLKSIQAAHVKEKMAMDKRMEDRQKNYKGAIDFLSGERQSPLDENQ